MKFQSDWVFAGERDEQSDVVSLFLAKFPTTLLFPSSNIYRIVFHLDLAEDRSFYLLGKSCTVTAAAFGVLLHLSREFLWSRPPRLAVS